MSKEEFSIEDFTKENKNKFRDMLMISGKHKDIYYSKEALLAGTLTVVMVILVLLGNGMEYEFLESILSHLISGLFGLLGFVIAGLSLIIGSLGFKVIKIINERHKFKSLIGIFFSFYFVGVVIAATIVLQLLTILIFRIEWINIVHFDHDAWNIFKEICRFLIIFLNIYSFLYSLVSSTMLMGDCIRLLGVSYFYQNLGDD